MTARIQTLIFSAVMIAFSTRVSPAGDAQEAFNPATHPVQRYQHIWKKSPFVTEAPVVQESGGLAQRFALTGVASLQDQPVIFVLDRQSLNRLVVTTTPNPQGLTLVSVEGQNDPKKSHATIRLGAEQAVIRYDLATLQSVNQPAENPQTTATPPANPAAGQTQVPAGTAPRATRVITRPKITRTN